MNLGLKTKLIGINLASAAALACIALIGLNQNNKLSESYKPIAEDSLPVTRQMGDVLFKFRQLRIEVRSIAIRGNTKEQVAGYIAAAKVGVSEVEESLKASSVYFDTPEEKRMYGELQKVWVDFRDFGGELLRLINSGDQVSMDHAVDLIRRVCPQKALPVDNAIQSIIEMQSTAAKALAINAANEANKTSRIIGGASLAISLALLLVALSVVNKLSSSISISIAGVRAAEESIRTNVSVVSSVSSNVLSAAQQQAASLQETSTALEEISAMVSKSAERSREVANLSANSKSKAEEGKSIMDKLSEAMSRIRKSNEVSAQDLEAGNQRVGQIMSLIEEVTKKTRIINDIVFQTKLLSFNASVEAARAGEHGKGFAVVAEEIGQLAVMSGNAAQEINTLLDSSMGQVTEIISANQSNVKMMVSASTALLDEGARIAEDCQGALSQLLEASSEVCLMVEDISNGSQESAKGVNEIGKAIRDIDVSSRKTNDAAGVCQKSAEQLSSESMVLKSVVADLNFVVTGTRAEFPSHQSMISETTKSFQRSKDSLGRAA